MSNRHSITGLQGEIGPVTLNFSGEVPRSTIRIGALTVHSAEALAPAINADLGRLSMEAEAELAPPAQDVNLPESPTPSAPANPDNPGIALESSLSAAHQRYESALLYLLDCPGGKLQRSNVGSFLRHELGLKTSDWGNLQANLQRLGLMSLEKASARRSKAATVHAESVLELANGKHPFITVRVLAMARALLSQSSAQSPETPAQEEVVAAAAEMASENGDSHNGNGSAPYKMSAQTRRMQDREPEAIPGYREDGPRRVREPQPFLDHRRARTGAKRRH